MCAQFGKQVKTNSGTHSLINAIINFNGGNVLRIDNTWVENCGQNGECPPKWHML